MAVCHAGHDTKFLGYGRSFCDCGEAGCKLVLQSQELAANCLKGCSATSIALDNDGRVVGTNESGLNILPFEVRIEYSVYESEYEI